MLTRAANSSLDTPSGAVQAVHGQYHLGDQTYDEGYCRDGLESYVLRTHVERIMKLTSPIVCLEVVNNFAGADPAVSNAFFQQYFLSIMQDIFFVLTDTDHKSGFKLQSMLLARMFQLVETNQISVPLFDPASVPDPTISNSVFLKEYTANLLKSAFPHVQL